MRLFHPQNLDSEEGTTPPYLTDKEEDTRLALLRETTQFVKEGKQRLPTPEKLAIMQLSHSFEKRRLGKQQQILSDMTQRCREQEVTDLSFKISAKCDLKTHGRGEHVSTIRNNPFYATTTNTYVGSRQRLSEPSLDIGPEITEPNKRVNIEKAYKFFPARKIMRQQTKINMLSPSQTKSPNGNVSKTKPPDSYGDFDRQPRYPSNPLQSYSHDSPRRFPNGLNIAHAKPDPLAPLNLPRLSMVDSGYQDRIDSYMSSNPIASIHRAKTYLDSTSMSGRSYRSMFNLSGINRNNHTGKSGAKSDRSEHGLMNIPFQHDEDHYSIESIGRGFGQSVDNLTG